MTALCFYFSMYKKVQTLKQKQINAIVQSCCKRLPIQYPVDIPFTRNAQVSLVVCSVILKNFILKIIKVCGPTWNRTKIDGLTVHSNKPLYDRPNLFKQSWLMIS